MADNLTTATIDVRANTRGLEKDILKALQTVELSQINTKKSSQALGRITGQVSEFNKSLEASNARVIAFGASAGAIFAVEKALASLITSTIQVEKKLTDINVLLGLSSSSLEKFGNSLFDVARNTAQSFSDVADAATELARQGLGIEETLKRTNAALILTRLSGLDAKSSVEALTATLNSFSGSALDAVEVVNKLANVDAAFAVSSADLANAISRVGSTAVDAGVSLDELIALVTSAQQTTARGGAVIGNSFKTIFTRLQRGKVQDLLGSLGVDTSEGQSAISLLQQLATTYDQLGSVQKSYIAEQVGGVFQINILKAALSDLGKEYSIYGRALDTSLSSTDQAIQRNELLNQTVAALSSQAVANLEQAANKIGSIVFEPNAKGFLKGFNDILSSFNNIDAESAGGKLMTGFFKGIGDFIGGPGAVLATAVLVKLFARLTQFAAGSAKELLGTNKAAQQQQAIEQSILAILQKNSQFTNQILTGKISTIEAEKKMLDYLSAQSNILREQERLSKVIGSNLAKKGVSIGASGIPMTAPSKKTGAVASGYIPNFATDMAVGQAMENAGAKQHGYTAGKAKKTTIHDGNGKSFKSFVNSKEDVTTFTNAAGKKATIVRPPNGFGENTQYAAGGFVPNFAKGYSLSSFAGVRINNPRAEKQFLSALGSKKNTNIEPDDKISSVGFKIEKIPVNPSLAQALQNNSNGATLTFENTAIQYLKSKGLQFNHGSSSLFGGDTSSVDGYNLKTSNEIDLLEVKSGKWNPLDVGNKFGRFIPENVGDGTGVRSSKISSALGGYFKEGVKENQDLIKLNNILAVPDTDTGNSFIRKDKKDNQKLAYSSFSTKSIASRVNNLSEGFIPNFASMGSKFKAMYGGGTTMRAVDKEKSAKKKNLDVKKLDLSDRYTMVHGGNQGLESANVSLEAGNKLFDAKIATAGLNTAGTNLQRYGIKGLVGDALVGATNNIIKTFGGTEQITDASSLDNAGSVGSAAGTVFETALRKAFNAPAVSQTQRIDFPAPTPELKKFFHNAPGQYEAKISRTPDNLKSALKKWVDVNGLASSAYGYIPNFAKSGLSYSYKDKDEFGFSEIQAIMGGKKVGSFSYAEDKKGLVDVGDFSVNKGERGKGIGSGLYKEAIRRNAGKKMKGQLLPQMNRLLQKIKNGEPVSAETLYPQIKRADLAKSSVFEVYGHKGMTVEKMTRDQFSSFVNAKINELKKDPKKLQSFFGNVEADEYGGLGVDLQTQHASGFVPNFAKNIIKEKTSSGMGGTNYINKLGDSLNTSIRQSQEGQKYIGIENVKRAGMLMNGELTPKNKKSGVRSLYGNLFSDAKRSNMPVFSGRIINQAAAKGKSGKTISDNASNLDKMFYAFPQLKSRIDAEKKFKMPTAGTLTALSAPGVDNPVKFFKFKSINELISHVGSLPKIPSSVLPDLTLQDLLTQPGLSAGFIPNFLEVKKGGLPFGVRGRANFSKPGLKPNIQLGVGATPDTLFHEASHLAYSKATMSKANSNEGIGRFISDPKKYTGVQSIMASSIFKNVNQNELFKSLGLNPVQLDFDGKNPGATYSGAKAIDEITTRIQEKIFKNKGDLTSLSANENAFIKNIEGLGIISNKRMSNVSRRSAEGSKFRSLIEGRFSSAMGGAARGFVPNFSNALNDAIARERSSGLSKSQIYVDKHSSLKNKNNPMGLMVANTRDEPNGGIQGINRAKKEGRDPKTYGAAAGFVPNFATGPIKMSPDLVDAMNAALKSVNSTLTKTPAVVNKFNEEVSDSSKKRSIGSKVGGFVKDNAIGVGFGLQSLASIAGEFAGNDDTKAGRVTKAAAGGVGDIASFAGTGAMIGGPVLAVAGGLIGLGKAAIDVTKALNTNVPDLEKSLRATSDSMNRFSESGQKLLTLNEQYGDALTSGNPAQAAEVMIKTQQAYAEELSKLTDVQRSSMISAIAQGKGQEQYAKILSEMQNSVKAQETATQLAKFSESGGPFSGPDKKLLAGMDKSLALDFTKGMDTSAIAAALEKTAASLSDQSRGTENQALDLMKNLAGSESLTGDQRENLNKMIEAFAGAAKNTDLSEVAEAFIKNIKGRPASDAEVKKAQEAAKAEMEARAAKTKKEIEIREKTNAMLIKLQSDTEAVYQRYNNSMEDFISSIETASEMMNAAGQFREEYLVQSGANKNITDPIKERNIVQKSNADLKAGIYKSQLETSNSFKNGVDSLLAGIEADSVKAGVGKSASDQSNQLLAIKSTLTQALLPVQEMITSGNFEGAKAKTRDVFNQLKPEERSALGEDKIADAVKQLESGIDSGARSQDLLVKNSQKDLAIQAQQLVFQKAMTKLAQAQNFGGTTNQILGDTEDSPFNKAIEAVTSAKIMGYNQAGLKQGKQSAVEGGDSESWGVNGKKPSSGTAEQIVNFYKAAGEIGGESVMSTESKDFAVLTQAIREQTRKKLDELRSAGEGVVDPAVFTRLETTLATLGGGDKVAQLKLMKELGFANISGKKITDEAMKGYTGGAFAGLDPGLKKGFEATSDEGAAATMLLLADQKNQTDSLNKGLENVVGTGLETNTLLSQQPSAIAAAIGAILEKGRAEQKLTEEGNKAKDLNTEFTNTSKKITENSNLIKEAEGKRAEAQARIEDAGFSEADLKDEEAIKRAKSLVGQGMSDSKEIKGMPGSKNYQYSEKELEQRKKQYEEAKKLVAAAEDYNVIQGQSEIIKGKTSENQVLGKKQQETTSKMGESAKRVQTAQEQLFEKTIQANIKKTQTLPAGGAGGKAYIEANKAEREQALTKNLAMQGDGVLTEQQKKSRARSQGGGLKPSELTYDVNANQRNTYEVAAMNQFGRGSREAFDSLMQQQVLPSFKNFSKIYEDLGGKGKGKEFYQQKRAELLGPEQMLGANKKNIQANQPAAAANIQPTSAKSTNPAGATANQPQVKNQQEQNKVETNTQENTNQIISSILQVVQKIATDFEQKAAGSQSAQTGGAATPGGTGVNVSAPVSLSINANNGGVTAETKGYAEKIKIDLAAFLSSPEFVDRVTTIAKNATGNTQPPKTMVK